MRWKHARTGIGIILIFGAERGAEVMWPETPAYQWWLLSGLCLLLFHLLHVDYPGELLAKRANLNKDGPRLSIQFLQFFRPRPDQMLGTCSAHFLAELLQFRIRVPRTIRLAQSQALGFSVSLPVFREFFQGVAHSCEAGCIAFRDAFHLRHRLVFSTAFHALFLASSNVALLSSWILMSTSICRTRSSDEMAKTGVRQITTITDISVRFIAHLL